MRVADRSQQQPNQRQPVGGEALDRKLQAYTVVVAAVGGLAAAVVAGAGMLMLRSLLQVRTIPERVLEWLLLFIPIDLFESGLHRFGFNAKRYALDASIVVMLGLLAWIGYVALRRRWPPTVLLGLGIGLWLFTMLVIMPLTSAGFFAVDLLAAKRANIGGYLAVGLVYAAVLSLVHAYLLEPLVPRWSRWRLPATVPLGEHVSSRRWALGLLGASLAGFVGSYLVAALLPKRDTLPSVAVVDPQEPVPSGGIDEPSPHPNVVSSPVAAPVPNTPASTPPANALPEPPSARQLTRDQDGAILSSGRGPGELPRHHTGTSAGPADGGRGGR